MIVRVVLLKLRDPAQRQDVARSAGGLRAAAGVRGLRVGRPADAGAEVWDVLVELSFADLDAANGLASTPEWRAFWERASGAVEVQKAWNFAEDAG